MVIEPGRAEQCRMSDAYNTSYSGADTEFLHGVDKHGATVRLFTLYLPTRSSFFLCFCADGGRGSRRVIGSWRNSVLNRTQR